MTGKFDLTDRQKAILQYVQKNPETAIKEAIIQALTKAGKGSRKTILKDIRILEEYGMVYIHKDKPNSQVHFVRIRNDSVLLSVMQEMDYLKKDFLSIFDAAEEIIKVLDQESDQDSWTVVDIRTSLQTLFQHFIGIYILYSIFIWPKTVADKEALDKIFAIVFEIIKEIQLKLSEVLQMCYGKSDPELELMTGKIVNHFFVLKPSRLDEMLKRLDNSELSEFAEPLLDHLWGASLRFVPDALLWNFEMNEKVQKERLKLIDKWRLTDWREVIRKKKYWNDEDYFTWKSPEQRCALNALEK